MLLLLLRAVNGAVKAVACMHMDNYMMRARENMVILTDIRTV
jgi:hypothetical protein